MKKGRSGDYLANCVLSRLGTYQKQGLQPDWASQQPKAMLPVGFHGFGRDADGKRLSKKQTQTQIARYIIGHWEREIGQSGELLFSPIRVVEADHEFPIDQTHSPTGRSSSHAPDAGRGEYVPLGTSQTLDDAQGWDVTLAQRIFRIPPDKLLRDLTPTHRKLARKIRQAFSLEESLTDDLIQEARLRVFENLHRFEGRSAFTTWAYTVSKRAMIDHAKRIVRRRDHEVLDLEPAHISSDFADNTDLRLTLVSALKQVPDSDLLLYQTFGYEDKEIADNNLRMRRLRARHRLRTILNDDLAMSA